MDFFTNFATGLNNFFQYVGDNYLYILKLLGQHIQLSFFAVIVAIFIGVPLGLLISRYDKASKPIMSVINVIQAVPSMAALGFMIPLFGIGATPAIIMVMLYALLPIVKNTATGLKNISPSAMEVAKGIGMTNVQILFKIQFPLAMPVIMAGVRISAVSAVGLMTLAAYIGAGGLGSLIFAGVQLVNTNMILGGAIPSCLLALSMDFVFSQIEKIVTPVSLRSGAKLPVNMAQVRRYNTNRKLFFRVSAAVLAVLLGLSIFSAIPKNQDSVVVTSKNFPEQILLGHMAGDLLEEYTDLEVDLRLGLGGTDICHTAMKSGEVDVQIEYAATLYGIILKQPMIGVSEEHVYETAKTMYSDLYQLEVLETWGFSNTYGIAVEKSVADSLGLKTLSDLAKVSDTMKLGATFEFMGREDGLKGVLPAYDMSFEEVIPLDSGMKYLAVEEDSCDAIVVFTTDGQIENYDLVILEDDRNFFLPFKAVPVIRQEVLEQYPEVGVALSTLIGELSNDIMQGLNYRVEVMQETHSDVAEDFLRTNGYIS